MGHALASKIYLREHVGHAWARVARLDATGGGSGANQKQYVVVRVAVELLEVGRFDFKKTNPITSQRGRNRG